MFKSILKRVRQFFRAFNANLTLDDSKYVAAHLSKIEQKLFFAMDIVDQCHCINTAYTIERFAIDDKQDIDRSFLIRCALLHDIGRVKGDMKITNKIFAVLIDSLFPNLANKLELQGNRTIYIYRHHAEIGARKLQEIGLYRESKIIARHHSPPSSDDPRELKLLRIADDKN